MKTNLEKRELILNLLEDFGYQIMSYEQLSIDIFEEVEWKLQHDFNENNPDDFTNKELLGSVNYQLYNLKEVYMVDRSKEYTNSLIELIDKIYLITEE